MPQDLFLVRQRHAESPDAKRLNRIDEILQVVDKERQIDRVNPPRSRIQHSA